VNSTAGRASRAIREPNHRTQVVTSHYSNSVRGRKSLLLDSFSWRGVRDCTVYLGALEFDLRLVWLQEDALHHVRHFLAMYLAVDSLNESFFGSRVTWHAAPPSDRIDLGRILLEGKTHET